MVPHDFQRLLSPLKDFFLLKNIFSLHAAASLSLYLFFISVFSQFTAVCVCVCAHIEMKIMMIHEEINDRKHLFENKGSIPVRGHCILQ